MGAHAKDGSLGAHTKVRSLGAHPKGGWAVLAARAAPHFWTSALARQVVQPPVRHILYDAEERVVTERTNRNGVV